jgi:hypothetical protein
MKLSHYFLSLRSIYSPKHPVSRHMQYMSILPSELLHITRFAPRSSNHEVVFTIDGSLSVHI